MSLDEFPCTCTHSQDRHRIDVLMPERQYCWVVECPCYRFKLDNLKYLEQEYEAKRK